MCREDADMWHILHAKELGLTRLKQLLTGALRAPPPALRSSPPQIAPTGHRLPQSGGDLFFCMQKLDRILKKMAPD
jgi:hypothetical protein